MDIRCNSCNTEYEFSEDQIPPEGVRVKCEVCQNIFQVLPPAPDDDEEQQVFMIRQTTGNILEFTELETLHEWILESIVSAEDEISSTGDSWAKLSQLPELEEVFAQIPQPKKSKTIEKMEKVQDNKEVEPTGRISPREQPDQEDSKDPDGVLEPLFNEESDQEPDFGSELLSSDMSDMYDEHFAPKPKARWPWVLGLFILILGGSLGGLFYLELLPNPFVRGSKGGKIDPASTKPDDSSYVKNARAIMKGGTRQAFSEAYRSLKKCPTADCFALKAYMRAMVGFSHFVELKLGDSLVKGLAPDSQEASNWIVQRAAYQKGIRDECLESSALSETAIQMGSKDPAAQAAIHLGKILQSNFTDQAGLDGLVRSNPQDALIRFVKFFHDAVAGKPVSESAVKAVISTISGAQLEIPLLQVLVISALASPTSESPRGLLVLICKKRPVLKNACSLAQKPATPEVSDMAAPDPMKKTGVTGPKNDMVMTPKEEKGDYDHFFMKAEQAYKLGDKAKARAYYMKAAQKDSTSADPLNGIGWCNMDTGNYSGAIVYFKKALALVPYYGRARYGLAEAYARSGSNKAALTQYTHYLSRHGAGRHAPRVRLEVQRLEKLLKAAEPVSPMVIVIPMKDPEPAMVKVETPAMNVTPNPDMGATTPPPKKPDPVVAPM
ncbi:zinc-ribbon domain-containing protein, partial [Myxococcota bacterium]|nr:zinc-ribbon domain-containing protein [Myxococcota bacterium]